MKHIYLLMLILFGIHFTQAQNVTGTISDESGAPIAGVNVIEKGTSSGVVSDFNGTYSIAVGPTATLIFSYVGYNSITVEDNGRGMSGEDFKLLSQPYTRKEGQKEGGSGLGLNICIAILNEHGFGITAEKLNSGTKLRINLK